MTLGMLRGFDFRTGGLTVLHFITDKVISRDGVSGQLPQAITPYSWIKRVQPDGLFVSGPLPSIMLNDATKVRNARGKCTCT